MYRDDGISLAITSNDALAAARKIGA
jgi:hypothetical protein